MDDLGVPLLKKENRIDWMSIRTWIVFPYELPQARPSRPPRPRRAAELGAVLVGEVEATVDGRRTRGNIALMISLT